MKGGLRKSHLGSPVRKICTLGSAWGDEFKKPRSLGEGTGAKASDNSEAPQRATAFKARLYHPSGLICGRHRARLPAPVAAKAGLVPTHERLGPDDCENLED